MSARRALPAAALLLAAMVAPAWAQAPAGFTLQTFEPAPAGDPFLVVPSTDATGHLVPAAALTFSFATEPLVLVRHRAVIPGGHLVDRQLWAIASGSLTLFDEAVLDVALPLALWQSGSRPFPDLATVSSTGLGDLRLGGRVRLPWHPLFQADLAAALTLWLPSGSRAAFAGDGAPRVAPALIASGDAGPLAWGASLGLQWREGQDLLFTRLGSGLTYTAGVAWRRGDWRVGPELYGRLQFEGTDTSPVEALLGGRWQRGPWSVGAGLGTGFDRAPGAAPFRLVTQATWCPDAGRAGRQAEAARIAAAREADERAAALARAEQVAAEQAGRLAAEQERMRAEAARLAAEASAAAQAAAEEARAAAARAEADRQAAEQAAAQRIATQETAHVRLTQERIEILQSIQFESDRDVIRPESLPILTDVAALLANHPDLTRVRIEGHTDASGPVDHNLDLSERRAQAVRRWLVDHGIAAGRLEARGYGPSRPIADNLTSEGKARNRRVVFELVK